MAVLFAGTSTYTVADLIQESRKVEVITLSEVPKEKEYFKLLFNGLVASEETWETGDLFKLEEIAKLADFNFTIDMSNRSFSFEDKPVVKPVTLISNSGSKEDVIISSAVVGDTTIIETKNFIFNIKADIYDKVSHYPELGEEVITRLSEYFGDDPLKGDKVDIFVSGDSVHGGGSCEGGQDRIDIFPVGDLANSIDFVLAHEIVHALQRHAKGKLFTGEFPSQFPIIWFTEGQADYFPKDILGLQQYSNEPSTSEGFDHNFYLREFKERYSGSGWGEKRDWSEYTNVFDLSQNEGDYFAFHAFLNFLVETYGMEKYLAFSDDMYDTAYYGKAFKEHFNKTDEELVAAYKVYYGIK